jgi:fructose-1-phosphate kinase PfkB-like protein
MPADMIVVLQPNPSGRRAAEIGAQLADAGAPVRVVVPRPSWDAFAVDARAAFKDASWVVMVGSLPRGAPIYGPAELIPAAHDAGAGVLTDLRGEVLVSALVSGPEIAVISAREASTGLGRAINNAETAVSAAKEFLQGSGETTRMVVVRTSGAFAVARREEPSSGVRQASVRIGAARLLANMVRLLDGGLKDVNALDRAVTEAERSLSA